MTLKDVVHLRTRVQRHHGRMSCTSRTAKARLCHDRVFLTTTCGRQRRKSFYLSSETDSIRRDSIFRICMLSDRSTCLSPMSTTSPPMMAGFTCCGAAERSDLRHSVFGNTAAELFLSRYFRQSMPQDKTPRT